MKQGKNGFTLIEVVIATTIIALITSAATTATIQVFRDTERNNNHITAVRQVQNAGYWISRDTQMAQSVTAENLTQPDFLALSWTDINSGDKYQVIYTLENMPESKLKKLQRNLFVNGETSSITFVAKYIVYDYEKTKCEFANGTLTLTITATVSDGSSTESETRTCTVTPRPVQSQ